MRDLSGKRVLISGAARGIGLALAREFAARGAETLLADLDPSALSVAAEHVAALGPGPRTFTVDVTDVAAVVELRERVLREAGPPDVLVNNAGVVFGGALLDVPLERHLATYRVNLLGLVAMTRTFLPDLISRPEASVVNLASASGLVGLPFGSTYASSKWGVIGFSESLRLELPQLGHDHVRVTTVCPSFVGTGLFEGVRPPRMTRVLSPERIARLTVAAVQRHRPFVLTPWLVRVTPLLRGILPLRWFDRVAGFMGSTTSMLGWRGRGEREGRTPPVA